jgi:hypothetical protein
VTPKNVAPIKRTYPVSRMCQVQIDIDRHIREAPAREAEALRKANWKIVERICKKLGVMGW